MGADATPLLEQVRREAQGAAAEQRAAVQREAERLRTEAGARAEARRTAALAERERTSAHLLEMARAAVAPRVARDTLVARDQALGRILARAGAQLEALAVHPRLGELLARLLGDALTYLPDGPVTVRCPARAAALLRAALVELGRRDALVREEAALPLGAIVESPDGLIAVDVTLARQLSRRWPQLSIALVAQLDGSAP